MQLTPSHGYESTQAEMKQRLKDVGFVHPTFTALDHI